MSSSSFLVYRKIYESLRGPQRLDCEVASSVTTLVSFTIPGTVEHLLVTENKVRRPLLLSPEPRDQSFSLQSAAHKVAYLH